MTAMNKIKTAIKRKPITIKQILSPLRKIVDELDTFSKSQLQAANSLNSEAAALRSKAQNKEYDASAAEDEAAEAEILAKKLSETFGLDVIHG